VWGRIRENRNSHGIRVPLPIAAVKLLGVRLLPAPALRVARNAYYRYLRYRIRNAKLATPIARRLGFVVQGGPFAGMRYPEEMVRADIESPFMPKLLGCYEMECNPFIEEICSRPYDQVINIGASEGYYAVGLAMRMRTAKIVAFETSPGSRRLCERLARLNGVADRIELRGFCDRESLAQSLADASGRPQRTVVLCDVEGAERDLLQPDKIGLLAHADLLVELHDFVSPGITDTITARFAATHRLEKVSNCERDLDAYAALNDLPREQRAFFLSEHRTCTQYWMFCTSQDPQ
jgi:hypothetical protein